MYADLWMLTHLGDGSNIKGREQIKKGREHSEVVMVVN